MPLIWTPQKATGNFAETVRSSARRNSAQLWGVLCSRGKEPHKIRVKKICGEYTIEATILNKMRLDKCDTYTAKETLGYRGSSKKRGKPGRDKKKNKSTNK